VFYRIFRALIAVGLRIFYRRIEAPGLGTVPRDGPLLLVANHGNALLDPLLLLVLVPRPISFLAKHTLFPMPIIGFFVRRIGGIPVYRRQDASGEASRNEATFEACSKVLEKNGALCIFPEGISQDRPSLQPLKTGAARIFFRADGRTAEGVRVVPVGLNFERKSAFRSRALILFGAPVPTEDLSGRDGSPGGGGVEELSRRMKQALESLLPGLETWEELEFIREIQRIYLGARAGSLAQEAPVLKRFISAYRSYQASAPEEVRSVRRRWEAYRRQLARFSITDAQVDLAEAPIRAARFLLASAAVILLVLPLAAFGWVVHAIPYFLCGWVERRINRHPDVSATVKFIAGLAFFPLTYFLVLTIPFTRSGWRAAAAGLVLLPVAGWAALLVAENRQRLRESAGALLLAMPGGPALRKVRRERRIILDQVAELIRRHPPGGSGAAAKPLEETDE
jgi:1-acyl-sn-glycerol-3-phosphate acyltransferase